MAYIAGTENTGVSVGKKHQPSDDEPKDEPSRTEKAWQVAKGTPAISAKSSRSFGSHPIDKAVFSWRPIHFNAANHAWRAKKRRAVQVSAG